MAQSPSFYVTARQPLRPGVVLLAAGIVAGALSVLGYAAGHGGKRQRPGNGLGRSTSGADSEDDDKDDPNQVDVLYLGDAADAPEPARRTGGHAGRVHATILVRLPRYGDQVGLIPDTPVGHLLYRWLAAFNQTSPAALAEVLPNAGGDAAVAAQMQVRQQTGGYNLLSAKEIAPGVLVFRLRDQTPQAGEALGTLQMRTGSNPPEIASLSLRGVP